MYRYLFIAVLAGAAGYCWGGGGGLVDGVYVAEEVAGIAAK
jgi:hypothetical protein